MNGDENRGPGLPNLSLIAALDRKGAIGRDQGLPWHLPDDLARFKALTLGKPLLMGRRTAQSLGRALPGRENWVLCSDGQAPYPGMRALSSLQQALALAGARELMVIGGGVLYAAVLPLAQRMYLTHVEVTIMDADTWFPAFDPRDWKTRVVGTHAADARHPYAFRFVDYERR